MNSKIGALVGLVISGLAFAAVAFAQAPTGPTYGGVGPAIDEDVAQGAAGEVVTSGGKLPFTGFDLAVALAVGLLLIAFGVATRRFSRARD